jgi:predicted membrane-bound dolichyl-phosphate-mannose-protein mannosyltransferase
MSNEFKSWEEYTPLEQAQCTFWDMYKDAHGIRPRHIDTSSWTLEQFDKEFAELVEVMKANEITKGIEEAKTIEKFERRCAEMISIGAKDIDMAMRWIHEAEGTQGDNDYLAWTLGLPYQYFRKVA